MPDSFGARLRLRREQQQIALAAIAEQTKIKLSLLEALERDDLSHWPEGIFRRAFVRAYADAVGLEPDVVVREFLELHPDPAEAAAPVPAIVPGVDGAGASAGPPMRLRYFVSAAVGSMSRFGRGAAQERRSAVGAATSGSPVEDPASRPAAEDPASGPAVEDPASRPAAEEPASHPAAEDPASRSAVENLAGADCTPVKAPASPPPDLATAAHLCTELGRVDKASEVPPLLEEAARILDAVGLIVWVSDPQATELRAELAHGYSDKVLAQLPTVRRDADNATAAAFRSAHTCVVNGGDRARGALAVPMMTSTGCVGVLAVELEHGNEQTESVRAMVTIFAAQLARWVGAERGVEASDRRLA